MEFKAFNPQLQTIKFIHCFLHKLQLNYKAPKVKNFPSTQYLSPNRIYFLLQQRKRKIALKNSFVQQRHRLQKKEKEKCEQQKST